MKKLLLVLFVTSVLLMSFSIFTSDEGFFRKYNISDIPMTISIHNSINDHDGWLEAVVDGANQWNEVESSFWEFDFGPFTTVSSYQYDGINLMYFDANYDNFTPGESVIAFSGTFTSGSGAAYHAIESDFIYNAAGFPPGINAEPDLIDLQSTAAHEFGHHIGLGHTGDDGNGQPGLGDVINDAVMYWAAADGDTTCRHLHVDDLMGLISIYPRVKFVGTVTNPDGDPISNSFINISEETTAAYYTEPAFLWKWQRGGYVKNDTIPTYDDGSYIFHTTSYNFDATFFATGFESYTENYSLGETSTEVELVVNVDIVLQPLEAYSVQYNVLEQGNSNPVNGEVKIFSVSDPSGEPFVVTDISSGVISTQLPAGTYTFELIADIPHEYKIIENVEIAGAVNDNIYLRKAQILLVDNDYSTGMDEEDNVENYYIRALSNMSVDYPFTYHDVYAKGFAPPQDDLNSYDAVVWFVGSLVNTLMPSSQTVLLAAYLESGGNIFMTGQKILFFNSANSFFPTYLKVSYNSQGPTTNKMLYPLSGNLISGDWMFMQFSDSYGLNNQTNPDVLSIHDAGANKIFHYHPPGDADPAGIYYEDATYNYKVVYMGFGFEALVDMMNATQGEATRVQVMENIINYFGIQVGIENETPIEHIVEKFSLKQNYPNPFNPTTTIEYSVAKASNVELTIYNSMGQLVKTLVDQHQIAQNFQVQWNGTNNEGHVVSSGLYYYRLKAGDVTFVNKMLFLK